MKQNVIVAMPGNGTTEFGSAIDMPRMPLIHTRTADTAIVIF
jgi:hypothetical protein